MPVESVHVDEHYGPIIVCDQCTERIRRGDGNVYFQPGDGTRVHGPRFVHKGCSLVFEQSHEPVTGLWLTEELDVWLVHLLENTGYNAASAKEHKDVIEVVQESL
jgi:hypothetical protein